MIHSFSSTMPIALPRYPVVHHLVNSAATCKPGRPLRSTSPKAKLHELSRSRWERPRLHANRKSLCGHVASPPVCRQLFCPPIATPRIDAGRYRHRGSPRVLLAPQSPLQPVANLDRKHRHGRSDMHSLSSTAKAVRATVTSAEATTSAVLEAHRAAIDAINASNTVGRRPSAEETTATITAATNRLPHTISNATGHRLSRRRPPP